jgi:hypothetical protein
MTPTLRWNVYRTVLIAEFLTLVLVFLFGLSLIEPLVLGDAHVKVSLFWVLMARSEPRLFFAMGSFGLGLFLLLELLRRWLRGRWSLDLDIAEL